MTRVNSAELGDELDSYRRELLAHCYRMLGSADEAEDLVQEVLLRAWRSRAGFEGRSSLLVWLYRTVTNAVIIAGTDAEARALVPPGSSFAFPGDLGSYGLIGTVDTVKQRIAAFEEAGVQELIIGFQDPTSVEQVVRFAALFG